MGLSFQIASRMGSFVLGPFGAFLVGGSMVAVWGFGGGEGEGEGEGRRKRMMGLGVGGL
jgi:hypothetical protein